MLKFLLVSLVLFFVHVGRLFLLDLQNPVSEPASGLFLNKYAVPNWLMMLSETVAARGSKKSNAN